MGVSAEIEALSYVDEHTVEVNAPPAATMAALERVVGRSSGEGAAPSIARVLGCEDPSGFHVASRVPDELLALAGRHRFSRYALVFALDGVGEGRTRLRAETRAEFPGLRGRAYRALVIGSRGHVLATRRLLRAVKARAERTTDA